LLSQLRLAVLRSLLGLRSLVELLPVVLLSLVGLLPVALPLRLGQLLVERS